MTYLTIRTLLSLLCSVPISKLPQLVYETQKDMEHAGVSYVIVGHAGDGSYCGRASPSRGGTDSAASLDPLGNFHAILTFKTEEELKSVRKIVHRMVEHYRSMEPVNFQPEAASLGAHSLGSR